MHSDPRSTRSQAADRWRHLRLSAICYLEYVPDYLQNLNQAYGEYKHVLANILRSRYVARTPPLEAHGRGRRSNVENASVTCWSLIGNARTPRKLGFALCCHSNATGAPIANPHNSAQLGGSLYHAPSYIRVRAVVLAYGRGQSDRQTDTQTDKHTDARDHNTFCVVYDSRKM